MRDKKYNTEVRISCDEKTLGSIVRINRYILSAIRYGDLKFPEVMGFNDSEIKYYIDFVQHLTDSVEEFGKEDSLLFHLTDKDEE